MTFQQSKLSQLPLRMYSMISRMMTTSQKLYIRELRCTFSLSFATDDHIDLWSKEIHNQALLSKTVPSPLHWIFSAYQRLHQNFIQLVSLVSSHLVLGIESKLCFLPSSNVQHTNIQHSASYSLYLHQNLVTIELSKCFAEQERIITKRFGRTKTVTFLLQSIY